jgi:IS30 family transposase
MLKRLGFRGSLQHLDLLEVLIMARPRSLLAQRRAFWRLIAAGVVAEKAGQRVRVQKSTGSRWFREAGGMCPISLFEPPAKSRYLTLAEREEIAFGVAAGLSAAAIGAGLGRDRSTIGREIARNGVIRWPASYRAVPAQAKAEKRATRPKTSKLAACPRLAAKVQTDLQQKWSPEQISRRLVKAFPDDPEMRVSHETIYQALFVQGRGGLKRELSACLRTGRALRKPRRQVGVRKGGAIVGKVMISERPPEVADRAVPGHWEGDLITGAANKTAIGTLVERTTRFTMLLHLPVDHGAVAVRDAIAAAILTLPAALRQSLTWDQGVELAAHAQLKIDTDLDIYFCDPHSPWQRGTNENTNGLLRQYFPKGTDLSVHPAAELARVAAELNGRPRKTLDWATPAEALNALLSQAA